MSIRKVFAGCVVALALLTAPFGAARAFVDPPTFSPEQPHAGQAVQMTVRAGVCHGFTAPAEGYAFLEVRVEGDIIDVIMSGVSDQTQCHVPPHTLTVTIGEFPEGNYTVRVRIRRLQPPSFPILPPASEAPLVVGAPPVYVPATHVPALIGLLGLVAIAAILVFRKSTGTLLLMALVPMGLFSPRLTHAQEVTRPLVLVELSASDGCAHSRVGRTGFYPANPSDPDVAVDERAMLQT